MCIAGPNLRALNWPSERFFIASLIVGPAILKYTLDWNVLQNKNASVNNLKEHFNSGAINAMDATKELGLFPRGESSVHRYKAEQSAWKMKRIWTSILHGLSRLAHANITCLCVLYGSELYRNPGPDFSWGLYILVCFTPTQSFFPLGDLDISVSFCAKNLYSVMRLTLDKEYKSDVGCK